MEGTTAASLVLLFPKSQLQSSPSFLESLIPQYSSKSYNMKYRWMPVLAAAVLVCVTSAANPNLCGPKHNNTVCSMSSLGPCCSVAGFCGNGKAYCASPGCLAAFGSCDSEATPEGPPTANISRPLFGSVSYDNYIYHCKEPGTFALTYDDGPAGYTSKLLDTLERAGAKATFFVSGNNNGKGAIDITDPYPSLLRRMIDDGHQVASHTWSHGNLTNLTTAERIDEMTKNERAIANVLGFFPTYMRPPYSSCTAASGCPKDLKALGYHRIEFDLDTTDYLNSKPNQIHKAKDVVDRFLAKDGYMRSGLAIQHDILEQSAGNLTTHILDKIEEKGWRAVTVGECLGDPEEYWYRDL